MTAHELARRLLDQADCKVLISGRWDVKLVAMRTVFADNDEPPDYSYREDEDFFHPQTVIVIDVD